MNRKRFFFACLAALTVMISVRAAAQDAPFIGVVTEQAIEVRSGAGRAYYVVGEIEAGDMVRVEKVLFNQTWYQIRVPEGVYSYVSKAFVDAQGDGETGRINADRTEFKAASIHGPGESYRVQGTLSRGDTVTIVGEEGNFYKIQPPADAFVFIPAGNTLRQATAADLEAAGNSNDDQGDTTPDKPETDPTPAQPVTPVRPIQPDPVPPVTPATQEAADPTENPGTTDSVDEETMPDQPEADNTTPAQPADEVATPDETTPDTQPDVSEEPVPANNGFQWPKAPDVEVSTPARSDALKQLEMKLLPYFSLPIDDQPLTQMGREYRALLQQGGLPNVDEQIITVRLRLIDRKLEIRDALARAEQAQQTDHARTVVPSVEDEPKLPVQYTAVGILMPSGVYDGTSLPRLYRLVDPAPSGRTIAYVAPGRALNEGAMLNQLIGVVGETTYDRALKLQVIQIQRADVLEAEPTASNESAE